MDGKVHKIALSWAKSNSSAMWHFGVTGDTSPALLNEVKTRYEMILPAERESRSAKELRLLLLYTQTVVRQS
jgi:hypothetical protein